MSAADTAQQRFRALQNVKHDGLPKDVVAIREYRHLRGGDCQVGLIVRRAPPLSNVEVVVTLTAEELVAWRAECQLIAQVDLQSPRGPAV